jgi:xanthine dehydrogenase accessory factor
MIEWNWIQKASELREEPFALLTITRVSGSAPREVGAKIILRRNGEFFGTIGGGKLESLALLDAKNSLEKSQSGYFSYPLGPKADQCCGGLVEIFVETVNPAPRLFIFGAGHVGQAVASVFEDTVFQVYIWDQRTEWIESDKLSKACIKKSSPFTELSEKFKIGPRDFAVVMTHSHDLDAEIVAALAPLNLTYLGLIGSESKWSRFQSKLKNLGVTEEDISKVKCPIGVAQTGKKPKAIAISLAAEVLALHEELNNALYSTKHESNLANAEKELDRV